MAELRLCAKVKGAWIVKSSKSQRSLAGLSLAKGAWIEVRQSYQSVHRNSYLWISPKAAADEFNRSDVQETTGGGVWMGMTYVPFILQKQGPSIEKLT